MSPHQITVHLNTNSRLDASFQHQLEPVTSFWSSHPLPTSLISRHLACNLCTHPIDHFRPTQHTKARMQISQVITLLVSAVCLLSLRLR